MLGLSTTTLGVAAAGYALAAAMGWAAWHEYGVARSQASRDQASVAEASATAADVARSMQQRADQQQIDALRTLANRAQHAYIIQQQITASAARSLSAANIQLQALTQASPPTACIRGPIPLPVKAQALWLTAGTHQ